MPWEPVNGIWPKKSSIKPIMYWIDSVLKRWKQEGISKKIHFKRVKKPISYLFDLVDLKSRKQDCLQIFN
jgi:hypothetical protein